MCSAAYGYNTNVVLTATPSTGSVFGGFVGGGCSGLSTTCTVNIIAVTNVIANYKVPPRRELPPRIRLPGSGVNKPRLTGKGSDA
jgi:hypothetical protein